MASPVENPSWRKQFREGPSGATRGTRLGGAADTLSAVASGYQQASQQELSNLQIVQGIAGAASAGFAVGGPIGAAIAAGLYIFGIGKGNSKRRKAEKQAANLEVATEPLDPIPLPYLYGYVRTKAVPVFFDAGNLIPASSTAYSGANTFGGLFKTKAQGNDRAGNAIVGPGNVSDEAVALQQYDLAAGGASRLIDVLFRNLSIRDTRSNGERNYFHFRSLLQLRQPGVSGEMARLFEGLDASLRRGTQSTFLNKAHIDALYWQWYGDPGQGFFDGQVEFDSVFAFGDKIRVPAKAGSTYSVPAARVESRNTFAVAFDFLTSPNKGPRNIPESIIHLKSLYEAWNLAEGNLGGGATDEDGGTEDGVELTQEELMAECHELVVENGGLHWSQVAEAFAVCMERYGRKASNSNRVTSGISRNARVMKRESSGYRKKRYQFDGEVPSETEPSEGLALILETAPGALGFRDNDGLFRFDIPDPSVGPADANYVQGEINDDHLLARVTPIYPKGRETANSVIVTHRDINNDLAETQTVFPTPGSTLANSLLALDGELVETELRLDGIADPEQAHSAAINYLMQRRRAKGTMITTLSPFRFLQGCRVRINSPVSGVDMVVRILDKQVVDNTIRWLWIEYHPEDYAYYPTSIGAFDPQGQAAGGPPAPTGVVAVNDAGLGANTITWDAGDDQRVAGWHVGRAVVDKDAAAPAEDSDDWTSLASVDRDEEKKVVDPYLPGDHDYHYRVRSIGFRGGFSEWAVAEKVNAVSVTDTPANITVTAPLPPGRCPPDNELREGDRFRNQDTGELFIKGPPWWTAAFNAAWNAGLRQASFSGHTLEFNPDSIVYGRGGNNMGVEWFSGGLELQRSGTSLQVVRADAPDVPDALFAPGTRNARFARIQFDNVQNLAGMTARVFFRADGFGSGGAGPHFADAPDNYFMAVDWNGVRHRVDLSAADTLEPYDVASIPLGLRESARAWFDSGDEAGPPIRLGLCDKRTYIFGNDLLPAVEPIPLDDTIIAVRAPAVTGGVVAAVAGISGTVGNASLSRGFQKVGTSLFIGVRARTTAAAFVGGAAFFQYIEVAAAGANFTVWPRFGGASLVVDPNTGDFGQFALVMTADGREPWVGNLSPGGTEGDPQAGAGGDSIPALLFAGTLTEVNVALVNTSLWVHGDDWPKAFEPDVAVLDRVWNPAGGEVTDSFIAFDESPPAWTGADFQFRALRASAVCVEGGRLSLWRRDPQARLGGDDGVGEENLWTLVPADGHPIPASERPLDTWVYDAARNADGEDVGIEIGGRMWFDERPETTGANQWLATVLRGVSGTPEQGDAPKDDWTGWSERVYYEKPVGQDAITLALSSGSIPVTLARRANGDWVSNPVAVRVLAAVVGAREDYSLAEPPDTDVLVLNFGVGHAFRIVPPGTFADQDTGDAVKLDVLTHPAGEAVWEWAVVFGPEVFGPREELRPYVRPLNLRADVEGALRAGDQTISLVPSRDAAALPGQPEVVTLSSFDASTGNAGIAFRPPAGETPDGYEAKVFDSAAAQVGSTQELAASAGGASFGSLPVPGRYKFSVAARNDAGVGPAAFTEAVLEEDTVIAEPVRPGTPRVSAGSLTPTSGVLTVTPAAAVAGAAVARWRFEIDNAEGTSARDNITRTAGANPTAEFTQLVSGLSENVRHPVRVYGVAADGVDSEPGTTTLTTTAQGTPPSALAGLTVGPLVQGRVVVTATPGPPVPGQEVAQYDFRVRDTADAPVPGVADKSGRSSPHTTFAGLAEDTAYKFGGRAVTRSGVAGAWFETTHTVRSFGNDNPAPPPRTPLGALAQLAPTVGSTTATLRVGAYPANADAWQFRVAAGKDAPYGAWRTAQPGTSHPVAGLVNDIEHRSQVRAFRRASSRYSPGPPSAARTFTPTAPLPDPRAISGTAQASSAALFVTLANPPDDNSDRWIIHWSDAVDAQGVPTGSNEVVVLGRGIQGVVPNLSAATAYHWRVAAAAQDGRQSAWSAVRTTSTLAAGLRRQLPALTVALSQNAGGDVIATPGFLSGETFRQFAQGVSGVQYRFSVDSPTLTNRPRHSPGHTRPFKLGRFNDGAVIRCQCRPTTGDAQYDSPGDWSSVDTLAYAATSAPLEGT